MMTESLAWYVRRTGRVLTTAVPLLLVTGCGATWYNYSRPGFTDTQFNSDMGSCKLMARAGSQTTATRAYGVYSSTTTPTEPDPGIVNDCMRSKGYTVKRCSKRDISTCQDD
jgi:hypothetical protein